MIKPSKVGRRKDCPNISILYREHLLKLTDRTAIQSNGYTVVMENGGRNMNHIIPELLEMLGCRVILLNRVISSPSELARWVKSNEADLGLKLEPNGQLSVLATDKGEVVQEDILFLLQASILLHCGEDRALRVPVNVPNTVEVLAARFNRQVIRTKADLRSAMEGCQHEGFFVYFDRLYTLVHLMLIMARKGKSLSQLIQTIPDFSLFKEKVECPWTEKGKVMRFLMEETKGKQVELIDGIKIFHEEGWTLILPDSVMN